ncbi:MAG: carbamoyltransferase [Cellvibrionaceae bacterium]|jgi:carbamoyltransferase
MYILGISAFYHDSAAALLNNGHLIAAADEERFSRKKHDSSFPEQAIQFCLDTAGIKAEDLDYVVFYEKPLEKFERILQSQLTTFPYSWRAFGAAMVNWLGDKLWVKAHIQNALNVPSEKIMFADHHASHVASSFFASPFKEAAFLTVDGVGEWTTALKGLATADWGDGSSQNKLNVTGEHRFPHSLGLLYSAFTAFLGFRVNNGEYKVMGMSPYGEPNHVDKIEKIFKVYDDGSFWTDMDYFSYHYSADTTYNSKFTTLFGPARHHTADFYTHNTNPEMSPHDPQVKENQYYADIAASIQHVTEETVIKMLNALHKETGSKNLVMAGGVALNSKANGRLLRDTPFENIFIQPAAGDNGGALGAALYAWHVILGKPREWVQEHNYWGAEYNGGQIKAAIQESGYKFEEITDEKKLTERVVDDFLNKKVVGWFQGRFEWGPRALGARSIMADPRHEDMKDIVNRKIKFREPFRPFAPTLPRKYAADWFQLDSPNNTLMNHMLTVLPFKEEPGKKVPAVNHMGTGRLQTVDREYAPRYYDLMETFGQATGVPILINTSFNLRGEPIVNTPQNAISTFRNSGIDTLVMENFIVKKG